MAFKMKARRAHIFDFIKNLVLFDKFFVNQTNLPGQNRRDEKPQRQEDDSHNERSVGYEREKVKSF